MHHSITRSELYERVWSMTMSRLAKEFGISDVGLAKICKRHDVPRPPQGYWNKLAAGQTLPRTPLPPRESDDTIDIGQPVSEWHLEQQQQEDKERAWLSETATAAAPEASATAEIPLEMPLDLSGAHPLIIATKRYCDKVPALLAKERRNRGQSWLLQPEAERAPHADQGRYHFFRNGGLDITASLEAMDWILRFHAAIFGALTARGFKFSPREPSKDRHGRELPAAIVATRNGESFAIEFKEGYKRVQLDEAEMAKRKKETGYAPYDGRDTVGSGNFKFIVTGTERRASSEWAGTRERLEKKLGEIVQRIDELVVLQPKLRQQAKAQEEAARRSAARQERARQIRASRAEQLKRAFAMAAAHEEHQRLAAYLKLVETEASELSPQQAAKLQKWIAVVRQEMMNHGVIEQQIAHVVEPPRWSYGATWEDEEDEEALDGDDLDE